MMKLKIGVLGVSNHFIKRVVLPMQELSNIELYAIASRSLNKSAEVAQQFNIEHYYGSYDQLLANKEVEAVYIPLPNHMHAEWIKKAANTGKHILCEKPMSMNAEEAMEVVEYCQKRGVILMEAFMYKHHPQWLKVRDIIRTNNIGKIQYINTSFSYNNASASNIRNVKEYGGGGLRDIGCYAISVPRFLLGKEPEKVVSLLSFHPEFGTDMLTSAILDFGTARATFNVSTCASAFQTVDVVASAGRITIDLPFNAYNDVPAKVTVESAIGTREILIEAADQYGLMIADFAEMVEGKQQVSVSEDDAILNQKVLDAVIRSSETSSWESVV
ncbi:Gfo/Idh/MocA family oxidoreductase [Carboxylicivirga mesophila]|uniref:Gfo/Idh/MocA family oxidoreductase n=1 Tax=Carboxylicivirga mesophila TaxID=1166478 RepID=A0ABS5KDF4_9BACT|nr:Gfo/Idh/MocA family oxidoreductase [Carboxylicivirga mesophila]MBS2213069.1 Gfo/Idh/MocA family oxidoreductase [Carboxylicivirga mesophila]